MMNTKGRQSSPVTVFSGFAEGKNRTLPIPVQFFTELLPAVEDPAELRLMLYSFWFLFNQDKTSQYLTRSRLLRDAFFRDGSSGLSDEVQLEAVLRLSVSRGFLIEKPGDRAEGPLYFLNSAHGRSLAKAYEEGKWTPESGSLNPAQLNDRPNVFALYEENIGPLTPLIGDMIKDSLVTYPPDWIVDALEIAVKQNARNWRYVEAILKSWQENGRNETNKRSENDDYKRFAKGSYSDLIER